MSHRSSNAFEVKPLHRSRALRAMRRIAGRRYVAALILTIGMCVQVPLLAQTPPDEWKFSAYIYGYLPQLAGSVTFPTGTTANLTADASDIISNLKFTFMGWLEAQKGPVGLFTDVLYVDVGGSKSGTRDLHIRDFTIPAGISADATLDVKSTLWTLGASYRLVTTPETGLDVLAGARMISLKQHLGWQFNSDVGPFVGPGRAGSGEVNVSNWDAIVGAKGRFSFGDKREWYVPYYVDVGTGQSQLTWQVFGGVGYTFSWGDVIALWRYIDYRFSKDNVNFSMNGPAIGVGFHW